MRIYLLFLLSLSLVLTSCNFFESFGDKTSNEALLFDAQTMINEKDYTGAIEKFQEMSAEFVAARDVQVLYATAYAGRCGLDLLEVADQFKSNSSSRLFAILFTIFPRAAASNVADCVQAETIIRGISSAATGRTANENLFLAFISFAKIGAIMNAFGDTNHDKTVDPAFDPCTAGDLSDANSAQVSTAIANAKESLEAVTTSVASDQLSQINSVCTSLAALPPAGTFDDICTTTSATTIAASPTLLTAIRTLINEDQVIGLGTCTGGVVTCLCP
jgi:hypothetical protein